MMLKASCKTTETYVTKDGSSIRELMHPLVHANSALSLADTVPAGTTTLLHHHRKDLK